MSFSTLRVLEAFGFTFFLLVMYGTAFVVSKENVPTLGQGSYERWVNSLRHSFHFCKRSGENFSHLRSTPIPRSKKKFPSFVGHYGLDFQLIVARVITSKPAISEQVKTGQWEAVRDQFLSPCRRVCWQVGFGSPASRAALQQVSAV